MSNQIIRLSEVMNKTGISRSSIYSYMNDNLFPMPIKLGVRSVGWLEHEVDSWLEERIASSRA